MLAYLVCTIRSYDESVHSQLKVHIPCLNMSFTVFYKQLQWLNVLCKQFTAQGPHLTCTLYIEDEATWILDSDYLLLGIGVY